MNWHFNHSTARSIETFCDLPGRLHHVPDKKRLGHELRVPADARRGELREKNTCKIDKRQRNGKFRENNKEKAFVPAVFSSRPFLAVSFGNGLFA
jgi:hypothetical protein